MLMTVSAIFLCSAGIFLSFAPQEIAGYFGLDEKIKITSLILQTLGAVYFAFGLLNWTAKANLIGGIYSRPVAVGNFVHFTIGALALVKGYFRGQEEMVVLISGVLYSVFAILFGIVFFAHPVNAQKK
jgi:hypothetical protein